MFRALNNDKIGNILRYFAGRIPRLPSMKAIKLLFFLDQTAMAEKGVPVTWLEYKAWKFGPVPHSVWYELRHGVPTMDAHFGVCSLEDYLDVSRYENEESGNIEITLEPKGAFIDDEFSNYELALLDRIVREYGNLTGYQLSQLSHAPEGPWVKTVMAHRLLRRFEMGDSTPDVTIDLVDELIDDERLAAYVAAKEAMETKIHFRLFANQHGQDTAKS